MPAKSSQRRSLLQVLLFIIAWLGVEFTFVGPLALAFVPLFAGGFVMWWFTTREIPVDPHEIIGPYLLTVIAFIAHAYEEYKAYLMGFPDIMQGAPFPITFELLLTFAASLAPIAWLLGAVMMLRRWSVGYFLCSTFLFGMMFIEPYHFIAPLLPDGRFHYVGGMWTAVLPTALGWYTFSLVRSGVDAATDGHGGRRGPGRVGVPR